MNVQIKYLDPRAKEFKPSYGTPGSAGVDLRAMIDKPIVVEPGETYLIGTGISIYLRIQTMRLLFFRAQASVISTESFSET